MTLVCFYIRDEIRHGISDTPQSIPTALPRVDPQTRLHNRLSCKCKCKCKLSLHIRVLANAAHRAKLLLRVPLPIRLPGHDHDATLLMWQPFVHPAKPSQRGEPHRIDLCPAPRRSMCRRQNGTHWRGWQSPPVLGHRPYPHIGSSGLSCPT